MSARQQDFAQRPLIAGSFIGIRSWRVEEPGILTGVHAQEPWAAGDNEAKCAGPWANLRAFNDAMRAMAVSSADFGWQMGAAAAAMNGRVYLAKRPKPLPRPEPTPHNVAGIDCECGFYAYFDLEANPHHMPGNVLGLIEGYGTMTIGQRGFRASKARIVALIEPVPDKVRRRYDVPIFATIDAALAEFPLSEPPAETAEQKLARARDELGNARAARDIAYGLYRQQMRAWTLPTYYRDARPATNETPRERALRLRRERNTGPAGQRGLDGRWRRA